MKILFTHSYFLRFDQKQWQTAMPYPPLGTLYAASYLRENGFEVKLFDTMFCVEPEEINSVLTSYKPDVLVSYDDGFNYLTKMCLTTMREACFSMIGLAKSKGCKVIVCSSDSTDHYDKYLESGADVVALGEGEQTLKELCLALKFNKEIKDIQGIAFSHNGLIKKTEKRTVLKDLDSLPAPAWDLVDINPYKEMWLQRHGYFSLNFVTTRGCPYKCNWCAKPIYGNRYHTHSPVSVVQLIQQLQSSFGFKHIWFADDIFGLRKDWINAFTQEILSNNIKVSYKIQSRADLLCDEAYVKNLAISGCEIAWIGAESGSQRILDAMEKGITIEQVKKAAELLRKHGIKVALFLQLGYLGENMEDIQKTLFMVKQIVPDDLGISVSYPLPGTGFYDKVKSGLRSKSNWVDSDDLDLMFQNTYKRAFYKELQRYIHIEYRNAKLDNLFGKTKFNPKVYGLKIKLALMKLIQKRRLIKIEKNASIL